MVDLCRVLVLVLVFRSRIGSVEFGPSGVKAGLLPPDKVESLNVEQREKGEQAIHAVLAAAQKQTETQLLQTPSPQPTAEPAPENTPTLPDVMGTWHNAEGLPYEITQFGDMLTLKEINPVVGVAVACSGRIEGSEFAIPCQTVLGTSGQLNARVSNNNQAISGIYRDYVTGTVASLQLSR